MMASARAAPAVLCLLALLLLAVAPAQPAALAAPESAPGRANPLRRQLLQEADAEAGQEGDDGDEGQGAVTAGEGPPPARTPLPE